MLRLALSLVLVPGLAAAADRDGWEELRQPAKVFALQDLEGRALRSTQLAGKVVVVDFWATWCAPCVKDKKIAFPVYKADALIGAYELAVFPTKLVVDMRGAGPGQPGVVRFRREGAAPVSSIEARVAEVLGEKP